MSSPSRRKSLLQNLALLAVGLCIGLMTVELVARALYDRPWYDQLSTVQGESEAHDYQLNAYGLRGSDFATPKPEGARRVYMVGDSFTFGMGVNDDALVMPSLVQAKLQADPPIPGIDGIEVLNGGLLEGSLPRDWWMKWTQVRDPYEPDVVLIVFFLRDGTDTGSIPAFFDAIRREIGERNSSNQLYQRSYLYRLYQDRIDRGLVAGQYTERFRQSYFGTVEQQREWRDAQEKMLRIKRTAEERGAVVGFVSYPILVDLGKGQQYPFDDICRALAEFANKYDIPLLELLPSFRGENGPSLWVSPLDQHPNEKGHAIAARAVAPFVGELLKKAEAIRIANGHTATENEEDLPAAGPEESALSPVGQETSTAPATPTPTPVRGHS